MTYKELCQLPKDQYDVLAEETAHRATDIMSLEDLINEVAQDLIKLYKQDPEILFRDADIYNVITNTEDQ
jgi:hypothetical protein